MDSKAMDSKALEREWTRAPRQGHGHTESAPPPPSVTNRDLVHLEGIQAEWMVQPLRRPDV